MSGERARALALLIAPVLLSLAVQLPAAIIVAASGRGVLGPLLVALAALGPVALLAAPTLPGPTVVVVAAATLASLLLAPDLGPAYVALAFAIVWAVVRGAFAWALAAVGAAWIAAMLLAPVVGLVWPPPRIVLTTLALAACFAAGWFIRRRRVLTEARREEALRRQREAREAERLRIANELHDVLGHSLALINVQAGVALHLVDRDPGHARDALEHIKRASHAALEEVRGVLGVLRDPAAPAAPLAPVQSLGELASLVDGVRAAGIAVEVDERVVDAVPWPVEAAAYRIVQEALTNVLRHADARRVRLEVAQPGDLLVITVDDDGIGIDEEVAAGALTSMRGRAEVLGGRVEVGRGPLGGTRVTARLPWGARE